MSSSGSLPPHLSEIVRRHLAAGHFRSETEVLQTALNLLDDQVHAQADRRAWLQREIEKGVTSRPAAPVTAAFWDRLRRRVDAAGSDRVE